jgi:hypothetical protein
VRGGWRHLRAISDEGDEPGCRQHGQKGAVVQEGGGGALEHEREEAEKGSGKRENGGHQWLVLRRGGTKFRA